MRRLSSELLLALLAGATATPVLAQEAAAPGDRVVGSEVSLSRDAAALRLELESGNTLMLELDEDGAVRIDGEAVGQYQRRDELDRSWRDLLQSAMDAPSDQLVGVLTAWSPPAGDAAARLDAALGSALGGSAATALDPGTGPRAADSIARLNERIRELERERGRLDEAPHESLAEIRDRIREEIRSELRNEIRGPWGRRNPFRHIVDGIAGVLSTLMAYAIAAGIGFLAVFFGRKYLEGIADTVRQATLRSGLVGLAGSFLVLPAFILGALALAISIVGIPLLLVFLPLFPVAVFLAAVTGYLAVAHAAGEALAKRRFTGHEWFTRANSYYYILTGLGLLLVLYLTAHIVGMAGPWLGFLEGLLHFLAVFLTWAAFTIGFGAFLISRGGTRPVRVATAAAGFDEEATHV